MSNSNPKIIIEHLDPELEAWQALEYKCIATECNSANFDFLLSGLHSVKEIAELLSLPLSNLTEQSVEALYSTPEERGRVCLLDPKAEQDLSPADGEAFDVFLFGGILGDDPPRGKFCASEKFVWGWADWSLGVDRTGELRKLGFAGRRLGIEQMTTDTAARVTRMVLKDKSMCHDRSQFVKAEYLCRATGRNPIHRPPGH